MTHPCLCQATQQDRQWPSVSSSFQLGDNHTSCHTTPSSRQQNNHDGPPTGSFKRAGLSTPIIHIHPEKARGEETMVLRGRPPLPPSDLLSLSALQKCLDFENFVCDRENGCCGRWEQAQNGCHKEVVGGFQPSMFL